MILGLAVLASSGGQRHSWPQLFTVVNSYRCQSLVGLDTQLRSGIRTAMTE